jgi:hypothetical protein
VGRTILWLRVTHIMKMDDYKFNTRKRQVSYIQDEIELDGSWFSINTILLFLESIENCEDIYVEDKLIKALEGHGVIRWSHAFNAYKQDTNFKLFKDALNRTIG